MCGIVAQFGANRGSVIEAALGKLAHRGIRSQVVKTAAGSVGHVRLPIVGLGTEHDQPVTTPNWTIAFVGEILNFKEIDPDLECDTDLVVRTWDTEGPRGFKEFDGFWSVVALEHSMGDLYALTDYLAQKPLYYRQDARAVASEPDALVDLAPVTPDEIYLSAVQKWGYSPDGRTPYNEIRRLPPGCMLTMTPTGACVVDQIDSISPDPSLDLMTELTAATRRRLLSADVPVAMLVSGGLDSSIVYHLARDQGDFRVYHADNGDAEAAAFKRLDVSPELTRYVPRTEWPDLQTCLDYMQEPLDLGSLVPQVALARAIAADDPSIRVVLTGDGADELFGGYRRAQSYDSQASDIWHELVHWHLPRLDRVMMRERLEVRSPFLARNVLAKALSLPRNRRTGKNILKDLFREDLPAGLVDEPKRPLKTTEVAADREGRSIELVELFRERYER